MFAGVTGTCGSHVFNGGSAVYDPSEGAPVQAVNPIIRDRCEGLGHRSRVLLEQ